MIFHGKDQLLVSRASQPVAPTFCLRRQGWWWVLSALQLARCDAILVPTLGVAVVGGGKRGGGCCVTFSEGNRKAVHI